MSNEPMKVTFSQGIHEQSATQKEILGTLRILNDGRKFRYCKNGGVALVAGVPIKSPAFVANHVDEACAANVAVGSLTVTGTLTTAATANQYKDGYLQINAGAGAGLQYQIDGNTAGTTCVIQLKEPIRVALTSATSKLSLVYNPWANVVASDATTVSPAGVPPIAVTASYYFWSQTGGISLTDRGTTTIGQKLVNDNITMSVAAADTTMPVAVALGGTGASGEYWPIVLTID